MPLHATQGPLGQQRFIELVEDRYYDNAALFRAIDRFLVQFGLASTKSMRDKWRAKGEIQDDPHVDVPFTRGIMSFAGKLEKHLLFESLR